MAASSITPHLVFADAQGRIYDHPELLMLCRRGRDWSQPRPDELIPLPEESEIFLLPGRNAIGLDPQNGKVEVMEGLAVAAFAAPAHTLPARPVYIAAENAPVLPLFAYGAVGFANGRFYVAAKKVDTDPRQQFAGFSRAKLSAMSGRLAKAYPDNRLMQHLMFNCVQRYNCPAARNLCLGRYEAPLPVSRVCNARCVACISQQDDGSQICATPQNRLRFTPTAQEIAQVMLHHGRKETKSPIFSFGQGCEGEPLTEAELIIEAIRLFRASGGIGTVNLNSNASRPEVIPSLAQAGLTSLRVSLNSARPEVYTRYYRPQGYDFSQVRRSIEQAHAHGLFVSLNLLFFPGISDTEPETEALIALISSLDVNMIQLRNLNIDPELYPSLFDGIDFGASLGFANFRKRLKRACPNLRLGYFNPYL
jgi:wyosine [tRNA(Phe)-imidazoG37] synthetase (radical SAM superfamily)